MRLGIIITFILLLLAAIFIIIGRRHLGALHLIRALLGLMGFLFAFLFFADAFPNDYTVGFNELLNSGQAGPAFDMLLNSIGEEIIVAAIIFLISIMILAWPPRRKQAVLAPLPNQGVS